MFEMYTALYYDDNMNIIFHHNHDHVQLARETNNQFWLANAEQLSVLETR